MADTAPPVDVTLAERRPTGSAWRGPLPVPPEIRWRSTIVATAWQAGGVFVISELCNAEMPTGGDIGLQWHITVSFRDPNRGTPRRARGHEVRQALADFGLVGAEEDNHHPGLARHFWLPLDPARRVACACKSDELVVVERDGFTWTTPADSAEGCRGCEHVAMFGGSCTLHPKEATNA